MVDAVDGDCTGRCTTKVFLSLNYIAAYGWARYCDTLVAKPRLFDRTMDRMRDWLHPPWCRNPPV